jgi:signal transduction histidine kinase
MNHILLVSRDQSLKEKIARILENHFSITFFTTIQEASAHLNAGAVNRQWLLIDLEDQADWESKVKSIKEPGVTLIAILSDPNQRDKAFNAGFSDYLVKPLQEAELYGRLIEPQYAWSLLDKQRHLALDQVNLVAVGRLVSHFCHEINNAMQAAGGALTLAAEEPGLTDEIKTYLSLCKDETQRVTLLVRKMRQLYRYSDVLPVAIDMSALVKETVKMAREELDNNGIHLIEEYEPDLPSIEGSYELIQLAILNVLFILCDHLSIATDNNLNLRLASKKDVIQLRVLIEDDSLQVFPKSNLRSDAITYLKDVLSYTPAYEIITAMGGELKTSGEGKTINISLTIPKAKNTSVLATHG